VQHIALHTHVQLKHAGEWAQVGVGNHEGTASPIYSPPWGNYGRENGGECGVMLARRMPMPLPPPPETMAGLLRQQRQAWSAGAEPGAGAAHPLDVPASVLPQDASMHGHSSVHVNEAAEDEHLASNSGLSPGGGADEGGSAPMHVRLNAAQAQLRAGALRGSLPPFWYSFDYASAHITMISTEHDLSPGSEQYR
jgi:hypothetical protein